MDWVKDNVNEKRLRKDVEQYLYELLDSEVSEYFVAEVVEEVQVTSGYEEEGIYSYGDIVICAKRIITELINDNY